MFARHKLKAKAWGRADMDFSEGNPHTEDSCPQSYRVTTKCLIGGGFKIRAHANDWQEMTCAVCCNYIQMYSVAFAAQSGKLQHGAGGKI